MSCIPFIPLDGEQPISNSCKLGQEVNCKHKIGFKVNRIRTEVITCYYCAEPKYKLET